MSCAFSTKAFSRLVATRPTARTDPHARRGAACGALSLRVAPAGTEPSCAESCECPFTRLRDSLEPGLCSQLGERSTRLREQRLSAVRATSLAEHLAMLEKHLRELERIAQLPEDVGGLPEPLDACHVVAAPRSQEAGEAVGLSAHGGDRVASRQTVDVADQLAELCLGVESPRRQACLGIRVPARPRILAADHRVRQLKCLGGATER